MFSFADGQIVAIKDDRPSLGLKAGDTGRVWALYSLEPPAYEVTFRGADGRDFDVTMSESELMPPLPVGRSTRKTRGSRVRAV